MTTPLQTNNLPVRPDLGQLKRQAKELLREMRLANPQAKLAEAQFELARSYAAASWTRLVQCCDLIHAIWTDDIEAVRKIVAANPKLIHENALVRPEGSASNWGPPMSYAANVGRDAIIQMLHDLGAKDHRHALGRALLQGKVETAKLIHELAGRPVLPDDELGGAAYTLSESGTALCFELGARAVDETGRRLAPVDTVLETDSRKPAAKHAILAMYEAHGLVFPDTPTMALHRGRIDLLEAHLARDPGLLSRRFSHEEIYPPDMGCHDEISATQGTPLKGTTLLHLCCDYDELEIANWLISKGADVNTRAAVDADGFGGHTPLFGTVISQPNFWMNYGKRGPFVAPFTELLLAHGADPNVRVSLRKKLHWGYGKDEVMREHRDVTPLSWGRRYHRKEFVSEPAMKLIEAAGGIE